MDSFSTSAAKTPDQGVNLDEMLALVRSYTAPPPTLIVIRGKVHAILDGQNIRMSKEFFDILMARALPATGAPVPYHWHIVVFDEQLPCEPSVSPAHLLERCVIVGRA